MAKYVDGFVFVVSKDKIEEYQKMAEEGRDIWMKHGAVSYFECMGDDLEPKEMGGMKSLGFEELTKVGSNETVWFSFITYYSKEHRDEVNKKVMDEMSEKYKQSFSSNKNQKDDFQMPFEMSRMAQGGFKVVVEG
jgi:uncharacterized protein YbaA (DUF1428 family)